MKTSLRSQLWFWMLPVVAVWIISMALVYTFATSLARSIYDEELAEVARSISTGFTTSEGLFAVELHPQAIKLLTYDLSDKFYYQVVGPHGRLVAGERNFPEAPATPSSGGPVFSDGQLHGQAVRIATVPVPVDAGGVAMVRVAETLTARHQLANRILLAVLVPGVICIFLLGATLYVAIGKSLAPLESIRKNVDERSFSDLHPLPEANVPVEVASLVRAINLLLSRLQFDIEGHRRFVANAAHQLRTPLAGIQTQTELALSEDDAQSRQDILRKIHIGAERGSRLVHQLLTLARVDESLKDSSQRQTDSVDLTALVASCIEELLEDAQEKKLEIAFAAAEAEAGPVLAVNGSALMLREMLLNIIDNAIRYAQTEGATVEVALRRDGDRAIVEVCDNGCGIPEAEQPRIFERFYRVLGSPPGGSGLGLAIVQEIAAAHHGTVTLVSTPSQGTRVTVSLPCS